MEDHPDTIQQSGHCSSRGSGSRSQSEILQHSPPSQTAARKLLPASDPLLVQQSIPRSPPRGIVNVKGQTLIVPNSALARAIVMGNEVGRPIEEEWNDLNGVAAEREAAQSPRGSPHPSRGQGGRPAVSNLTVLLQQQQHQHVVPAEPAVESPRTPKKSSNQQESQQEPRLSTSSSDHTVDEADQASGPPPAPASTAVLMGRSAPNILNRDGFQPLLRQPPVERHSLTLSGNNAVVARNRSTGNVLCDQKGDKVRR